MQHERKRATNKGKKSMQVQIARLVAKDNKKYDLDEQSAIANGMR
jgi:hypothetical protein